MLLKLHEWLADHIKWVQYPGITTVGDKRRLFNWKYQMPIEQRFLIGVLSILAILAIFPILIALAVIGWAFFSSI